MAAYQIFVKLLDGRTQTLQFPSPTISGETLKLRLRTPIPLPLLRLVTGTREISDQTLLSSSPDGAFPSVSLLLRLPGGKGGFGSLLRGAATKAGQKKTNNFDACRDMSGRRLRHVNAEKKLEEWKAAEEERRRVKAAEEYIRKKAAEKRKEKKPEVADVDVEKYKAEAHRCLKMIEESVRDSVVSFKGAKKRKGAAGEGDSRKRLKIWLGKKKVDESDSNSDSDDDEEEGIGSDGGEEKSVVLDGGSCSSKNKEETSGGGSEDSDAEGVNCDLSIGESSGGESDRSNLVEVNGSCDKGSLAMEQDSETGGSNSESSGASQTERSVPEIAVAESNVISSSKEVLETEEHKILAERPVESQMVDMETVTLITSNSSLEEPLDFDKYNSPAELEVLGMERLKSELQERGLKCGGTQQERAARLFLLKTTPLEKLPKKVLAKPTVGGK